MHRNDKGSDPREKDEGKGSPTGWMRTVTFWVRVSGENGLDQSSQGDRGHAVLFISTLQVFACFPLWEGIIGKVDAKTAVRREKKDGRRPDFAGGGEWHCHYLD